MSRILLESGNVSIALSWTDDGTYVDVTTSLGDTVKRGTVPVGTEPGQALVNLILEFTGTLNAFAKQHHSVIGPGTTRAERQAS